MTSPVFLVSWEAVEQALSLLAAPTKASMVPEAVRAVKLQCDGQSPNRTMLAILSLSAWLVDDGPNYGGAGGMS